MPAATGSVYRRLYRGETNIDFIGQRKKWYLASGILIAICVLAMVFRGFLFGIEFSGGDQYQIPVKPGTTLAQVRASVESTGVAVSSAQIAGTGSGQSYVIRTERLSDQQADLKQVAKVRAAPSTSAHAAPNDDNGEERR